MFRSLRPTCHSTFDPKSTSDDISTIKLLPQTKDLDLGQGRSGPVDLGALADLHALGGLSLWHSEVPGGKCWVGLREAGAKAPFGSDTVTDSLEARAGPHSNQNC